MIAQAQYRFESTTPEYQLALEGDANGPGFLDVIDQYGSTRAGNLAKHYAGICYLRLGDLDNAATYLAKYKPAKGIPAISPSRRAIMPQRSNCSRRQPRFRTTT